MRPYSLDLRERVLAAVDHHEGSIRWIARIFRVSTSFIADYRGGESTLISEGRSRALPMILSLVSQPQEGPFPGINLQSRTSQRRSPRR